MANVGKKSFLKNNLFRITFAFLLLIILPFGVGLFIINTAYENQIRHRRQAENNARLISMQETITNMHLDLNRLLIQMRLDDNLSPSVIHRNGYRSMMAMLQLRRYTAASSNLHQLVVVDTSQMQILSNVSSDNAAHFARRNFGIDYNEIHDFWRVLEDANNTSIADPLMVIPSVVTRGNVLIYSAVLQETRVLDSPRAILLVDATDIESRFADALPMETAGLVVANEDGMVLLSAGTLPEALASQPTILHYQAQGLTAHGYMLTYSIAPNGWHYYMFLPTADLLYDIREVARLYGFFALAFAVASVLFFILYFKIYHSLEAKAIGIQKELDESYPIRRNYLLHQLFIGGIREPEGLTESRVLSLKLERLYYTVVILLSSGLENGGDMPVSKMEDFLHQFMPANDLGYCVEGIFDKNLAILLALPVSDQKAHRSEVVRIQSTLSTQFNVNTMACMGGVYSGIGDIHLSFQEATRASKYRYVSNKNNTIAFSDTGEDSAFARSYPTETIQGFCHALKYENKEALPERLRAICRMMSGFTITFCRCIYSDLSFSILHYLQEQSPVSPLCADLLDDIIRAQETQEMQNIQQLTEQLEKYLVEHQESKGESVKDRVRLYINNHFHEPSLSIDEMAENFGISAGYLSRVYKKEAGETLLSYINTKRIDTAKSLLSETDMPLHEIVHKIGYFDVSSFHRKFKSTEGITPGAYRDKFR